VMTYPDMDVANSPLDLIGHTPMVRLGRIGEGLHCVLLERSLVGSEGLQQRGGDGIAGAVQAVHPFLHHMSVAQFSQAAEEALPRFLHLLPGRIRIDGGDAIGHGAAAAESHTQVVYRIGRKGNAGAVAFFEHALHPESEA